jgi:hypothetical protein
VIHNPIFINGYPALCPNDGKDIPNKGNNHINRDLWIRLSIPVYHNDEEVIGYKCKDCGCKVMLKDKYGNYLG